MGQAAPVTFVESILVKRSRVGASAGGLKEGPITALSMSTSRRLYLEPTSDAAAGMDLSDITSSSIGSMMPSGGREKTAA